MSNTYDLSDLTVDLREELERVESLKNQLHDLDMADESFHKLIKNFKPWQAWLDDARSCANAFASATESFRTQLGDLNEHLMQKGVFIAARVQRRVKIEDSLNRLKVVNAKFVDAISWLYLCPGDDDSPIIGLEHVNQSKLLRTYEVLVKLGSEVGAYTRDIRANLADYAHHLRCLK